MSVQSVRWGVLSTAQIGRNRVVPAIQAAVNAELVAIASRDARRARAAAREFDAPRSYGDYDALLDDHEIDAVYIPLPNALHARWAIRAAEKGKHVLCEKPLAATASEAADVVDACAARNVRLMEAFMYRHHPRMGVLRQLLADGALGDVRLARASFGFMMTDYENVRLSKELAGGCMWDVGCYPVNFGRMVFGREPTAASATAEIDPKAGVDVLTCGWLDFGRGARLLFDCSFVSAGNARIDVVGTKGRLTIDSPWASGKGKFSFNYRVDNVDYEATGQEDDSYRLMVEHFMASLPPLDKPSAPLPPLPAPAEDGLANMRAIDAVKASFESGGRPVEVAAG